MLHEEWIIAYWTSDSIVHEEFPNVLECVKEEYFVILPISS